MLNLCQLLSNHNRFSILLSLADQDTSAGELEILLEVNRSTVYRHLQDLRGANLIIDYVAGFDRGPRRLFCLTTIGRQTIEALRSVAENILRSVKPMVDHSQREKPARISGRITLNPSTLIQLLEELGDYQRWRLLHGLIDEDTYYAEERRIHQLANEASIETEWLRKQAKRR